MPNSRNTQGRSNRPASQQRAAQQRTNQQRPGNRQRPANQQRPNNQQRPVAGSGKKLAIQRRNRRRKQLLVFILVCGAAGLFAMIGVISFLFSMLPTTTEPISHVSGPVSTPLPTPGPVPTPTPTPTPEPTPDPMEGMVHSSFTGLPILEETDPLRPIAVVINNHSRALPQAGVADADIIYEVLAEGQITRLVGIFHHNVPHRIGPVRSTRDYFADFAIDNDAIFAHHGGSPTGYARLRNLGIAGLDGMALEGTTFWRDPDRRRVPALFEHSSYTGAEVLEQAIASRNFRRNRHEDDNLGFAFNLDENMAFEALARASGGIFRPCVELTVPFSNSYPRRFVYDPETMTYAVYNVHGPHIDENIANSEDSDADAQVRVTNVLVQHVRSRVVPGDVEGRREVNTVGSGSGYLASNGGIVTVRWERDSHNTPTRWYFANGMPLQLTPGSTWINVLQDTEAIRVVTGIISPEEAGSNDSNESEEAIG